jgi:hypothetical protein
MSRQAPLVIDNGTGYTKMGYVHPLLLVRYLKCAGVPAVSSTSARRTLSHFHSDENLQHNSIW